jgi:protease-4
MPINKKTKIIIASVGVVVVAVVVILYLSVWRWDTVTYTTNDFSDDYVSFDDPTCNVAGINLHGEIMTYVTEDDSVYDYASGEYILSDLEYAGDLENIKAIILEIDSYGGSPVASEELANFIKTIDKPVIAMVREAGASGAYWVASSADKIFASEISDIGGIGVTMSYVDYSKSNIEQGFTWNSLSTGKYKDAGSMDKPLTREERALFERDLRVIHEKFIKEVATNRGMSVEAVTALADGSTVLGGTAKELGLIDEIGSYNEVESYIEKQYGFKPEVCF